MKKPWDTWVLKGLSINEAAPLFEKMERIQMEPWGHTFGWKYLTLPDGRKVKLTIQKNGTVPIYFASVVDEGTAEYQYYMDSGFVKLDTLFGNIWQNDATRSLYFNYTNPLLDPFGPKIGVDNGNIPPSFVADEGIETAYADKVDAIKLQAPGSYTGKLRWLLAGQYGLKLDSTEWLNRDDFTRINPATPRRSGEGIFTDDDRQFWYLQLDTSGTTLTGTATLLDAPFTSRVDPGGLASEVERQAETHILAIAKRSTTEWPIVIDGDALVAGTQSLPVTFGYGWKFSQNGRNAAILLHDIIKTTGGTLVIWDAYEIITYAYEATITKDDLNEQFIFSITETSQTNWYMPFYATIWKPTYVFPDIERQSPFFASNQLLSDSFLAPIHCYYNAAGDLQTTLFSFSTEEVPNDFGPCGVTLNGRTRTINNRIPGGTRRNYKIVHEASEIAVINGPISNGLKDTSLSYSTTDQHSEQDLGAHRPYSVTWPSLADCPSDPNLPSWSWASSGFGVGCQINRIYDWIDVSSFNMYGTDYVNGGTFGAVSVVVPFDDSDSVVAFIQDNTGAAETRWHRWLPTYVPSTQNPGILYWRGGITLEVTQVPGYPIACPDIGTYASGVTTVGEGWGTSIEYEPTEENYTITTTRALLSPDAVDIKETEAEADFILDEGAWIGRFYWDPDAPPSAFMTPLYVSRAESGAAKWNDGLETHLKNDYPPDATLVIGWA